jgi:hypothetical protein
LINKFATSSRSRGCGSTCPFEQRERSGEWKLVKKIFFLCSSGGCRLFDQKQQDRILRKVVKGAVLVVVVFEAVWLRNCTQRSHGTKK